MDGCPILLSLGDDLVKMASLVVSLGITGGSIGITVFNCNVKYTEKVVPGLRSPLVSV